MTTLMSDDGTGQSDDTVLDTGNWVTEGSTAGGGTATYQSEALEFKTGNEGGYAGTSRTTRSFNITSPLDVEVSGTFTHDSNEAYPLIIARASSSGVDYTDGYYLLLSKGSTIEVGKVVSYSGTTFDTASKTISASTTYGFRFQVLDGASHPELKAKVWTGTEPGTWDIEYEDTGDAFTSAGKAGITIGVGSAAVNHTVTFDDIVVTDGAAGSVEKGPGTETLTLTDAASLVADVGTGAETLTLDDAASLASLVDATGEAGTLVDAASLDVFQLFHELKVEIEFTPGIWTDVSDRVVGEVETHGSFGRPTRFDDVSASTFDVTLRNSDGALTIGNPNSPYFPNVEKGMGVRSSISWAGQDYPLFYGSAIDIDMPSVVDVESATVTIQCADVMASLERKTLLSPWVEEARRVARYSVTGGWTDVFPFPASTVKTETSVQVADTSFENKGVLGPSATVLGSCLVVPAANGGGSCRSSGADRNGGALTEGTLDFEIGDNGSGRQTHPILKFIPQSGFQQFELLFKVPTGVLPPTYSTGTHTVTAGQSWDTMRTLYGLTYDELRLLNPDLAQLDALAVDQVININDDGKAGSEWVLAQFFAGSTEVVRVCLVNNGGALSLILRHAGNNGAAYVWNGSTLADEKWRKLTVFKNAEDSVRCNLNDSPSGQTMTSLPADMTEVTTVYVGGRVASASAGAGGHEQCPEFSVGGAAFHKQSGVWSYYVLGAPPANITARQRLTELARYADPVPVSVETHYSASLGSDPFATLVVRTDITDRSVLECMQELARTVGAYLWVDPESGALTMRKGPTEPYSYLPVDLIDDADDSNPPRWRNTIDSEPTRVTARCPAGEATSVNTAAETKGLYNATDVDTCAATVAAAKAVADRYVGALGTLHLTNLQVDLMHAGSVAWRDLLSNFLPTEMGIRMTNTISTVTGFDTIDAVVESWTFTSTVDSAKFVFETTPIRVYNSPSLPEFTVSASTGTQTDGTLAADAPSGVESGDLLLAILTCDEDGTLAGLHALSTWAEQGSGGTSDAGFGKVFTKVAGSSEPSVYQFTVDGIGGTEVLMQDVFTGTDTDPFDSSNWDAGETRTGASRTIESNTGKLDPGTLTGYAGRVSAIAHGVSTDDVGIVVSFKTANVDSYPIFTIRGDSGGLGSHGYQLRPGISAEDGHGLSAITEPYSASTLGYIPGSITPGTWYRIRFEAVGTTVRARVWPAGDTEPSSWGISVTDAQITAAGTVFAAAAGGGAVGSYVYIDDAQVYDPTATVSYPESHLAVLRIAGADTTDPFVIDVTWSDDDTSTTSHDAPSVAPGTDGLLVTHWHITTDGS